MDKVLKSIDAKLLHKIFSETGTGISISDPSQPDNPLIYVNQEFLALSGFTLEDCIGRNCRFLQGKETDQNSVDKIRVALEEKTNVRVTLKNYRKDGTPFWNDLQISSIFNDEGHLKYFIGISRDVTEDYIEKKVLTDKVKKLELEVMRLKRDLERLL